MRELLSLPQVGVPNAPIEGLSEIEPSAERAAKRIEALYKLVGPRLGVYLVEANVVLTLADARGDTEFFIENIAPEDYKALDKMKKYLHEEGIRVRAIGKANIYGMQTVNVSSLDGYGLVSSNTKIPGFFPFNPKSGWEGFSRWNSTVWKNLQGEYQKGTFPNHFDVSHILIGVHKGYPDIAIYDATDIYGKKRQRRRVQPSVLSKLPFVKLYHGAEPNYRYYKHHSRHPEITGHQKLWSQILKDFYNSPWHQKIRDDPKFIESRESCKKAHRLTQRKRMRAFGVKSTRENEKKAR